MLQQPRPPKGLQETKQFARVFWDLVKAKPDRDLIPCRQQTAAMTRSTSTTSPIRPWPGDGGVITLGLVITKDPETGVPNVGVYRLQRQSVNTMTVHWLRCGRRPPPAQGGGHGQEAGGSGGHRRASVAGDGSGHTNSGSAERMVVRRDLCRTGVLLAPCKTLDLQVPSHSEVVLEGTITPERCCRMVLW